MLPPCELQFIPCTDVDDDVLACELEVMAYWYGDTEEMLEQAYGAHVNQTVFLVVRAEDGQVFGTSRLIVPGRLPLKTVSDIALAPWGVDAAQAVAAAGIDLKHTWDVATIGVRPSLGASGRTVATALYHGLMQAASANAVSYYIAVLDKRVRSLMAITGLASHVIPGTQAESYMGSPLCIPIYIPIDDTLRRQRQVAPEDHELLTTGIATGSLRVPGRDAFRLPRPVLQLPDEEPVLAPISVSRPMSELP